MSVPSASRSPLVDPNNRENVANFDFVRVLPHRRFHCLRVLPIEFETPDNWLQARLQRSSRIHHSENTRVRFGQ
ncbi:unnamed protein product, partial [Nesidiocoris tenuis]